MTLGDLITAVSLPDDTDMTKALGMEVRFDTASATDLVLLSVYVHDGVVRIDIGK